MLKEIYSSSLSLLTDLYQLTMAYGYWKTGKHNQQAVFNLFFRENPFKGGYTIACGLEHAIEYVENFKFTDDDLSYLSGMKGNDGNPLFKDEFLTFLGKMNVECDISAIPEGTVVFPHEPLMRIKGPIYQCQILETPLLNIINFQSLVATKASRIKSAALGDPVLEFGLRRAQGVDGSLAASRAAYIGGCDSTSNILAGKLFGIPVSGTHAHSWIMSFKNEEEAFRAYARAMPNNVVFLVDTYDTIEGIRKAISVGKELHEAGGRLAGIRIDSGDLAYFGSIARKMLDESGFTEAKIVASNDLDEHLVASLNHQKSQIGVWGVGTKLVTAFDQPALGGVYKLAAIQDEQGNWQNRVKLSEQTIKVNNPGIQQVMRFSRNNKFEGDMIFQEGVKSTRYKIIDPSDPTRSKSFDIDKYECTELLKPVYKNGVKTYDAPQISEIRDKVFEELDNLDRGVRRFDNPHTYPVGLEEGLHNLKNDLILKLRNR